MFVQFAVCAYIHLVLLFMIKTKRVPYLVALPLWIYALYLMVNRSMVALKVSSVQGVYNPILNSVTVYVPPATGNCTDRYYATFYYNSLLKHDILNMMFPVKVISNKYCNQ